QRSRAGACRMKTLSSKQFRFVLSLCILAEVVVLTLEYRHQDGMGSLPMSQLSTLESGVQNDIRQMELAWITVPESHGLSWRRCTLLMACCQTYGMR
ncbi:MAG: hypothetical protein ACJZ8O_09270, partial [Pirellulaceae bacterium]